MSVNSEQLVVLGSSTEPSVIVPDLEHQGGQTVVQNANTIEIEEAIDNNNTNASSVVVTGTTANVQPIIIQMAPAHHHQNVIHQPSSFFHHPTTIHPTVIPLQTATIRPLGSPVSVMPPNKLPLPRNTSTSATGKLCCKQENLMNGVFYRERLIP